MKILNPQVALSKHITSPIEILSNTRFWSLFYLFLNITDNNVRYVQNIIIQLTQQHSLWMLMQLKIILTNMS